MGCSPLNERMIVTKCWEHEDHSLVADFYNCCIFQEEKITNNTTMYRQCCMCIINTQKSKCVLEDQEKKKMLTQIRCLFCLLKPEKYNTSVKIVPE